ncbi:MAG: ribonuclease III [Lachnospiraceae bacterium]|nr:ribonuclease III [Lachnospiraceae bacterium]
MEESIRNAFETEKPNPDTMPVLTLAFIGDSAFELIVRTAFAEQKKDKGHALSMRVQKLSSARGQAAMAQVLQPFLTEEEAAVYRRGRNAQPDSVSKHAGLGEYHRATGLEALIGYLYLTGRTQRAAEIIRKGAERIHGAGKDEAGN